MLRINHAFYTLSDLASELSVGWDEAFCQLINSNHSDRFLSAFGKGSISRKGPCDLRDNYLSVRGLLSENPASPNRRFQPVNSSNRSMFSLFKSPPHTTTVCGCSSNLLSTMLVIGFIESTSAYLRLGR